jgi:hypothetical protein
MKQSIPSLATWTAAVITVLFLASALSLAEELDRARMVVPGICQFDPNPACFRVGDGTGLSTLGACPPTGLTCQQLAESLLGQGIAISNVQCTGDCRASALFNGGAGIIGFDSGLVLSSGCASGIIGPNNECTASTRFYTPSGSDRIPGDPDLDCEIAQCLHRTLNAVVLEFDFACDPGTVNPDTISFEYVFGSEEYNDYVEEFFDAFAFFLNGTNIALVPGAGQTPVSIGTINCGCYQLVIEPDGSPHVRCSTFRDCPPYGGPNCNLFRNNEVPPTPGRCVDYPPINTGMDGLSVPLTATGSLHPGSNHIKLVIADYIDDKLDSYVLLKAASFVCQRPVGACCDRAALTCVDGVDEQNCAGEWLAGLGCDNFNPPCREPRMLVLLDRTGSMNAIRLSTGNSRCFDALQRAKDDVEEFFAQNPNGKVAVWTFRRTGPTAWTNGFVNKATALAALNSPGVADCSDLTPLAESMCSAVDALAAGIPVPLPEELILAVSSDGEENNSLGECFGPNSGGGTECGQYDAGSWQQLVCEKVMGHSVVMARYWGALQFARSANMDDETGELRGASVSDAVFFANLAAVTGGTYRFMDDAPSLPTVACCNSDDRCVEGLTREQCTSIGGSSFANGIDCSQVIACAPRAVAIPTVSTWSMIALAIGLLALGSHFARRRVVR